MGNVASDQFDPTVFNIEIHDVCKYSRYSCYGVHKLFTILYPKNASGIMTNQCNTTTLNRESIHSMSGNREEVFTL